MVQPDSEQRLDRLILDVFERTADVGRTTSRPFYFPVTSQKDARAFVRELNSLGLQYDVLCASVREPEPNFTSWRTGLGRPGIGNRVIERINRPIQQLLLTRDPQEGEGEGEGEVDLTDVDEDDQVLAQLYTSVPDTDTQTHRHRPPIGHSPATANPHTRRHRPPIGHSPAKNGHKTSTPPGDQIDRKYRSETHTGNDVIHEVKAEQEMHESRERTGAAESCHTDGTDREENNNISASCEQTRGTSDDVTAASQPHNGTAMDETDTAIPLLLRPEVENISQPDVNTEPHQPEIMSQTETETEKHVVSTASRQVELTPQPATENETETSVTEVEVKPEVTSPREEGETERSGVSRQNSWQTRMSFNLSPKSHQADTASAQRHISVKPAATLTSSPPDTCDSHVTSIPETQSAHAVLSAEVATCASAYDQAEIPPTATSEPEVAQQTDDDVISVVNKAEVASESVLSPTSEPSVDQAQNGNSQTARDDVSAKQEVTSSATVEINGKAMTGVVRRQVVAKITPGTITDDVSENYDSTDDEPDQAASHVTGSGNVSRRKRRGVVFSKDGPGYIYAFTDTRESEITSGNSCRVKISASRKPEARLLQGRLFNLDIRLVSAVKVSRRLAAAFDTRKALSQYALPDTLDWFSVPLDGLINTIMGVAREYPPPADS